MLVGVSSCSEVMEKFSFAKTTSLRSIFLTCSHSGTSKHLAFLTPGLSHSLCSLEVFEPVSSQPRQESNLDQKFRKLLFYPLNYGAKVDRRRGILDGVTWCAWQDLNLRPMDYESTALTTELQAQGTAKVQIILLESQTLVDVLEGLQKRLER